MAQNLLYIQWRVGDCEVQRQNEQNPATNWNKKLLCCATCHFVPLFEVADTLNSIEIYSFLLKNCACSHYKFLQFSSIFFSQHSMGMPSVLLLLMVALLQLSSRSLIKLCNSRMS